MQTKLSVALAATLAGFALNAQAANVEVYGLIDTGLNYQHVDSDRAGEDNISKFQMKSSQSTPNRLGLRGTEEIGPGLKVGFVLESQFSSDDGSLMPGNRLFHRAAQVMLMSDDYGTLVFGRSGMLRSGFGTTGIWGVKVNPFSNSWGDYMIGSKYIMPGGFKPGDNTITYQSPVWSGLQLHAQYSNQLDAAGAEDWEEEGKNSTDRQWALGATYTGGPVHVSAVLDSVLYGRTYTNAGLPQHDPEDSLSFSLAATYDFGFMKLFASGMYFSDMLASEFQGHGDMQSLKGGSAVSYKGYSLQLGTTVPAFGGTVKANIGWMDASVDHRYTNDADSYLDTDRIGFALGYVYPLSKKAEIYVGAGVTKDSANTKDTDGDSIDPIAYEVLSGLLIRF